MFGLECGVGVIVRVGVGMSGWAVSPSLGGRTTKSDNP